MKSFGLTTFRTLDVDIFYITDELPIVYVLQSLLLDCFRVDIKDLQFRFEKINSTFLLHTK